MKSILAIFLIGLSIFSFGQDTKKVKNKISKDKYEVFYVLKSDGKIKQGFYELYEQKKVIVSGYYKLNQKDSIWTEYKYSKDKISQGKFLDNQKTGEWIYYHSHSSEEQISAKGYYLNGKRINLWEFYNNDGELIQTFDFNTYSLNTLVDSVEEKSAILITNGKYKGLMYVDEIPTYKNGDSDYFKFLAKNLVFPVKAKINGIQGKVYTSFIISETGEVSNFKIVKSAHEILDKEALRVLKLTNGKWTPATFENETVSVRNITPLSFILR